MANKPALLTIGKTLNGDQLFVMSVYDLEPSGIIVQAYSQVDSKEYSLAVSEKELIESKLDRGPEALAHLLETTYLSSHDTNSLALQSTLPAIKVRKKRPAGSDVDKFIKAAGSAGGENESIHEILLNGLVALSDAKPVGQSAVTWLGEWLLNNNPRKPAVSDNYSVEESG